MAELHFLRPAWLIGIPLALALLWWLARRAGRGGAWRGYIAPALQPHLLAPGSRANRHGWFVAAAGAAVAFTALAGPAWERLPETTFRSQAPLVLALDLSRSMDATDVSPSRLERAKLELREILRRRPEGQTALLVYSSSAFTVTPLTTDVRTVDALVATLETDLMPSRGSFPAIALERAARLLEQAGLPQGDVLLVTDSAGGSEALDAARELAAGGVHVSVLGVGTRDGAPIPSAEGGFLTDRNGQVVVPRLDERALERLARAGGGRYARLVPDDADLATLLASFDRGAVEGEGQGLELARWRDRGPWLLLALLPLALLAFRRGWALAAIAAVMLVPPPASAFEWRSLWARPDQRAAEALERGEAERAAELFRDPEWKAAAEYRAGRFEDSADTLAGLDAADAHYNRGNALARLGRFDAAIAEYEAALALEPDHEDARHNRDLLMQQQASNQSESGGERQSDPAADASGDRDAAGDPTAGDESPEPGRQADGSPSDDAEGDADRSMQAGQPGNRPGEDRQLAEHDDTSESDQAIEQWLRRIPDDPGGLLRRKFLYQYQREGRDQDGRAVWPGDEVEPW